MVGLPVSAATVRTPLPYAFLADCQSSVCSKRPHPSQPPRQGGSLPSTLQTRPNTTTALPAQTEGGGVCSGCGGPQLGAGAASGTNAGESRGARDHRAAGRAGAAPPVWSGESGYGPLPPFGGRRSRHLQKGVSQQAQRDMPMPPFPAAHLVLIQPHLLSALEAFLDRPARPGHLGQGGDGGFLGTEGPVKGHLLRLGYRAADQQPVRPPLLRPVRQPRARPVVDPRSLT